MKELIRVRVQYASRQQCCKTHKRPLPLPLYVNVSTYGIPLWGSASHSNIEILQRFQNKVLRTIASVPMVLYVANKLLHTDLQMPTFREEITKFSTNHRAKLLTHPNELTSNLLKPFGAEIFF